MSLDKGGAVRRTHQLLAQCRHKDAQRSRAALQTVSPDVLRDVFVRQNLPDIPGKQTQQLIFYRGETDLLPVKTGIAGGIIDGQGTVMKNGGCGIGRGCAEPPQRDPQSCQKLRNGKGFCQIIVCPGVQRVDFVGIFTPGADDDDGYIRPRTDPADACDAVQMAKLVREFAKSKEQVKVKCGMLDGNLLKPAEVDALADLPSREVLLAQLLGLLQAPGSQLVRVLNAKVASIVYVLDAYCKSKEQVA